MATIAINGKELEVNNNEAKEALRIAGFITEKDYAQKTADIWMRSAPTTAASDRRKAVARALGLSDVVTFA